MSGSGETETVGEEMSHSVVTYTGGQVPAPIGHRNTGGEAEEEWVTKKKVEITTTKAGGDIFNAVSDFELVFSCKMQH